ncbi:MAG: hypothetical protein ACTJG2_02015 [Candidatus Saccharimonadales bacterium]
MAEYVYESKPAIIEQNKGVALRVAITGAVVGLVTWMLAYALQRFVLGSLFCGDDTTCERAVDYSGAIALIVTAIVGVIVLVRSLVYRPLLIVLGAVVSLWGIVSWLSGLTILEQVGWMVLLFALAYSAYAWLARVRNVVVMLILVALLLIASRVIPMMI